MGVGKRNKKLASLHFQSAFWTDPEGTTVTLEQLSDPEYEPWVTYIAYAPNDQGFSNSYWKTYCEDRHCFIHHVRSGDLYWVKRGATPNEDELKLIKQSKLIYETLMGKMDLVKIDIAKNNFNLKRRTAMGYAGNCTLSSGIIYAPYVPPTFKIK